MEPSRNRKKRMMPERRKTRTLKNGQQVEILRPFWTPLIVCLVLLSLVCCMMTYSYILADFKNENTREEIVIEEQDRILYVIEQGMTTTQIAEKLKDMGLIGNVNFFKIISKLEGYDGTYKTGSHYLKKGLELKEIMKILSSPTETIKVMFPEGFTIKKIAARLASKEIGLCTEEEFLYAVDELPKQKEFLEEYTFLKDLPDRDHVLEGYLFPDTYLFDLAATPEEIIRIMLNNFENRYLTKYQDRAAELWGEGKGGLTMDEVIVIASIVEKECQVSFERRKIAGVFCNRLRPGSTLSKLESCATLQYIIDRDEIPRSPGLVSGEYTKAEMSMEDRYNTYKYEGLPAGPICNPGMESIKAVLYYEEHNYKYFVLNAKADNGTHVFGKTYTEHEQNIKNYQKKA